MCRWCSKAGSCAGNKNNEYHFFDRIDVSVRLTSLFNYFNGKYL